MSHAVNRPYLETQHISCQSLISRRLSLVFRKLQMKDGLRPRVRNSEFYGFPSELSNGPAPTRFAPYGKMTKQQMEENLTQSSCYSDLMGESVDRILPVADSRCPVASTR